MNKLIGHFRTITKHRHAVIRNCRRAGILWQGLYWAAVALFWPVSSLAIILLGLWLPALAGAVRAMSAMKFDCTAIAAATRPALARKKTIKR